MLLKIYISHGRNMTSIYKRSSNQIPFMLIFYVKSKSKHHFKLPQVPNFVRYINRLITAKPTVVSSVELMVENTTDKIKKDNLIR